MLRSAPPVLSVQPCRALADEAFQVLVKNLPPGCPFTIRSLHQSETWAYWEAFGHYMSDHTGRISVSEDVSLGGTYTGKEAMGLLWSMRPVADSPAGLRWRNTSVASPLLFSISVFAGHEALREQPALASALTERWFMSPGVQQSQINDGAVRGNLFIPPGLGPFPGILDLCEGPEGLMAHRAALLASRGYVCLTPEYLGPGILKSEDLDLIYFEEAFAILREHPRVISERIGILGLGLGSAVSLQLAAGRPNIMPRCVVCISNVHIKPPELRGFPRLRDAALELLQKPALKVPVGKINCPILLVNGGDDQSWCSVETAEDMTQMMRASGKEHLLSRLEYPDTGHLIEPPFLPHVRASTSHVRDTKEEEIFLWGGRSKPHADAQEDSWRKILSFMWCHLYCSHMSKL